MHNEFKREKTTDMKICKLEREHIKKHS